MAVNLSPVFGAAGQLFNDNGDPLAGGKIYTYLAGTTTNAVTYTTAAGNIQHTNPIILDGAGRVPSGEIWLTDTILYKFIVEDAANNLIGTYDNITGINSETFNYVSEEETQTATQGQTVFTLTTIQYVPLTNNLLVFVNGSKQIVTDNYTETSTTSVTFVNGLNAGDVVDFITATPTNTSTTTADLVLYKYPAPAAVQETVEERLAQRLCVKDFGAVGDGVTDDSAAFQAAIDFAALQAPTQPSIFIPAGDYVIGTTLDVNGAIEFKGENFAANGTRIFATNALNAPMFDVTSNARFFSISLVGSNNASNTNETLVTIVGANDVTFENVFFFNSYTAIKYTGSTPAFYNSYSNCTFTNTNFFFIVIDNSSSAGVDLIMNHCRFLGNMVGGCWNFALGLGSIIASDIQISLSGGTPAGAQYCFFGTPAPNYGGAQFTNVVFEGGGSDPSNQTSVYLLGTALLPWKEMHFDNCLLSTGNSPSLVVVFATGITFTNCSFSSISTNGIIQFAGGGFQKNINLASCTWQGTGGEICIKTLGNSVVECYVTNPYWGGIFPFIDFTSITSGFIAQIDLTVIGGYTGGASETILLSDYKNCRKNIQITNSNYGPIQYAVYTGTTDGSGNAIITHGINFGNSRIVSVSAFYKGGSGEARPMTITSVDGTQILVTGGGSAANANYRVFAQFVQQAVAW
jgi:hypothetical protein